MNEELRNFLHICKQAAQLRQDGLKTREIANQFGWELRPTYARVSIGLFPDEILKLLEENERWTPYYMDHLVSLKRSLDGLPLNFVGPDIVRKVEVDYTKVIKAINLVNSGVITSARELQKYASRIRDEDLKNMPTPAQKRERLITQLRAEIQNELRGQIAITASQLILSARKKSTEALLLRQRILGELLTYATNNDLEALRRDLENDISELNTLRDSLVHGNVLLIMGENHDGKS